MQVRNYTPEDYEAVEALYKDTTTFGGQFDEARDTKERLQKLIDHKPDGVLVAEEDGEVVGTVTLFEDGRSGWLYRFAVKGDVEKEATEALWNKAKEIMKNKGHTQILVYAPAGDSHFEERYAALGFNKGNDFTAYWQDVA